MTSIPRTTVLQRAQLDSATLWDQVLPARTWQRVLRGAPVTVALESDGQSGARLVGARGTERIPLGPIPESGLTLSLLRTGCDWLWVEGATGAVTWTAAIGADLPAIAVVVPTYRRDQDATAQARRFAAMEIVDRVIVIDQGGTLADHRPFEKLLARTDRIDFIEQDNLGGSGGYARGLLEATRRDPGAAVLFSDDDAVISEESLRRMATYQALADRPTIIGTPLFSASDPLLLAAHTETVHRARFQWRSADGVNGGKDLSGTSPVQWGFLDQDAAPGYTGWWGTLFPPGTIDDLGMPAPLFLKWDDAEYGMRASDRGYDHAVLSGTSVHHPPWSAYGTQMSWPARALHRNRLAIAAARGAGRAVIASSLAHQIKHVLAGHLLTAELWEDGIAAVLDGPDAWLGHHLEQTREDGRRIVEHWWDAHSIPASAAPARTAPTGTARGLVHALRRMLRPGAPARTTRTLPAADVHWRTTLGADVVVVTDAAGTVLRAFAVRGSAMRRTLLAALRSHARLALRWDSLRRSYADALPRHATAESWLPLFDDRGPSRDGRS